MRALVFLFTVLPLVATAQQPPYDQPPVVEAPYFRVRYEASMNPGELIFPVQYTVWIPAGVETLRGVIVHQHGCGEGSCKSGQTGAFDLHWQALARKHECALLAPSFAFSDTPAIPLMEMRYTDTTAETGKTHQYRVITVNTAGLESK